MKRALIGICVLMGVVACSTPTTISSPDGRVRVSVDEKTRTYDVEYNGRTLVKGAEAQLMLGDSTLAWREGAKLKVTTRKGVTEHVEAPLYRQAAFDYTFNEMNLDFGNGFGMVWRVSDDGAAYRFTYSKQDTLLILSETARYEFPQDWEVTYSQSSQDGFKTSFEGFYSTNPLSEGSDQLCFLPVSINAGNGIRVNIAESGAVAYPGAFVRPVKGEPVLESAFAPCPGKDYIAQMLPGDSFPWRIIKITEKDGDIATDNLVYALAEPSRAASDLAWLKPGFSAWEWWNDWGLEGVDFKPGINDATYKYYIDFAAANGLEYVILDEGWGKRGEGRNLLVPIPELHLKELAEYGQSKGVRLILWAVMDRLLADADNVMAKYEAMGIAGFKPDFYNRNDQVAIKKICNLAEIAEKHHMFLDIHGAFPPMGLNRTYPNIINTEGVAGLENCRWLEPGIDFMKHDIYIAFLRQMGGPCDYTPGAMKNSGSVEDFRPDYNHSGSQGTRAHQVALYGVLDSPLTMLCDSPTNYEKNQETTDFIASLPRNYASKRVLEGVLGEYIVVERVAEDGSVYLFGLTDFTSREVALDLSFLGGGEWTARIFKDSQDTEKHPESYEIASQDVSSSTKLTVGMASGGGFAVVLRRK